jgi:hypothetical protein
VSPTGTTHPLAPWSIRSGAAATPSVTMHGTPEASASLTMRPQLSQALGTMRASAAANASGSSD